MRVLIVLIPLLANANYVSKSEWNSPSRVFAKREACEKHFEVTCYEWPKDAFAGAVKKVAVMVNDKSNPLYSRRVHISHCGTVEACELLKGDHCSSYKDLIAYIDKEQKRIYCSKFLGYEKIRTGDYKIVKDPVEHAKRLTETN